MRVTTGTAKLLQPNMSSFYGSTFIFYCLLPYSANSWLNEHFEFGTGKKIGIIG